jgi:hypothetical protein
LCRHIARPARANERLQCDAAGQVALRPITSLRGGTTQLPMSSLEFVPPHIGWPLGVGPICRFRVSSGSQSTFDLTTESRPTEDHLQSGVTAGCFDGVHLP